MQTTNRHGSLITALAVRLGHIKDRKRFNMAVCEECQPETDVYSRFGELIEAIDAAGQFSKLQYQVWRFSR